MDEDGGADVDADIDEDTNDEDWDGDGDVNEDDGVNVVGDGVEDVIFLSRVRG